ncbi:DUF4019 domain-containing protein, partial [Pseudomonas sp. CrR25]|nr:DUF4019 domain-containing protein [Pseudomonas sp. CrR25]
MARTSNRLKTEKIAVFVFGVVFLTVILTLVVVYPYPTLIQFFVFRLVLALSAAGIGALLPGFINIDLPLPLQGGLRAGGALALFASVWFVNPATLGVNPKPPAEEASPLMKQLLDLSDAKNHKNSYALFALRDRQRVSESAYESMLEHVRDPLGNVQKRILVAADTPDQIMGISGPFVRHFYQTKFSNSDAIWGELVTAIAEDG